MKRLLIGIAIFFLLGQLASSYLQFRMSASEVAVYFEKEDLKPRVLKIKSEDRIINYIYLESNQNNLAVFVHGAPGSSSAFIDFIKNRKLQKSMSMISVDRPGYGYSGLGKEETSVKTQARHLANVVRSHKNDKHKVVLVGHSLGAPIIARMAMDYPELADGLIFVGGSIDPKQEKKEWYRPLGSNFIGKIILPKSLWVTNEEICFLKEELEEMLPLWHTIQIPVTVIHGEDDGLVPKENVQFAKSMLRPELIDVWLEKGVNHFIPWNRPDLINKALLYHIDAIDWRRKSE